jgi:hypothetical protein
MFVSVSVLGEQMFVVVYAREEQMFGVYARARRSARHGVLAFTRACARAHTL